MAHLIKERDAQYGIIMAWHKLTKIVQTITKEIAFPWQVLLAMAGFSLDGKDYKQHGRWIVPVASDDNLPLGNGQPLNLASYTPRNPHEVWDFVEQVLTGTKYQVVSAGTVDNRSKYFISTKLIELETIRFEDGTNMDLLLNTMGSMDRALNEQTSVSGTRIVCNNTLMISFLKDSIKWRYRHSKNMNAKIDNDKPVIEQAVGLSAVVKETFDKLIALPCDTDRASRVYAGFITPFDAEEMSQRAVNMVEQHVECFSRGDGNMGKSEFDLLNGFTQLRTRGYAESKKSAYDQFNSSEFGTYAESKTRFAGLLVNDRTKLAEVEERGKELLAN